MLCGNGHTFTGSLCVMCRNEARMRSYERNKETEAAKMRLYYVVNCEAIKEKRRQYHQENPEVARRNTEQRRAQKRNAFVEHVDPLIRLELDDGACGICEGDVNPFDFHVDHIIPLALGGEHSYANTQVAHPYCNMRKGVKV